MSDSDSYRRPTEIRERGVRILKYLDDTEFDDLTAVFYKITITQDDPLRVTFHEPIPDSLTFQDIHSHGDFNGSSWSKDGSELVFHHKIEPDEEVTTLLAFSVPMDEIPDSFIDREPVPEVERLDPSDAKDTVAEKLVDELKKDRIPETVRRDLAEFFAEDLNEEAVTQAELATVTNMGLENEEKIETLNAELESLRDRVAKVKSEQVSLKESVAIVERRIDDLQSEHEAELKNLNRNVKDVEDEMNEVREKTGELPDDVGGWLSDVEGDLDAIQSDIDRASGDHDTVEERLSELDGRIADVSKELSGFQSDVSNGFENLRDRVTEQEDHLQNVQNKARAELNRAEEERDDLEEKLLAVRNGIEKLADSHEDLTGDVEELDDILADLVVALHTVETAVGADEGEIVPEEYVDDATSGRFL